MLMVSTHKDGVTTIRSIGRKDLPVDPPPPEGRRLTHQQFNDAVALAAHAMSRRIGTTKDDYAIGLEALGHIVGDWVALQNEHNKENKT